MHQRCATNLTSFIFIHLSRKKRWRKSNSIPFKLFLLYYTKDDSEKRSIQALPYRHSGPPLSPFRLRHIFLSLDSLKSSLIWKSHATISVLHFLWNEISVCVVASLKPTSFFYPISTQKLYFSTTFFVFSCTFDSAKVLQ